MYTTEEDVTLEKAVVDLLLANELTVSTIESCTGGMLAARLINIPGVSEVFKTGYITYSNKAKENCRRKKGTLDKFGAVSPQTAKEMARGTALLTKADVTFLLRELRDLTAALLRSLWDLLYGLLCVRHHACKRNSISAGTGQR